MLLLCGGLRFSCVPGDPRRSQNAAIWWPTSAGGVLLARPQAGFLLRSLWLPTPGVGGSRPWKCTWRTLPVSLTKSTVSRLIGMAPFPEGAIDSARTIGAAYAGGRLLPAHAKLYSE